MLEPALEGSLSHFALESGYFPGRCARRAVASACERDWLGVRVELRAGGRQVTRPDALVVLMLAW